MVLVMLDRIEEVLRRIYEGDNERVVREKIDQVVTRERDTVPIKSIALIRRKPVNRMIIKREEVEGL